MMLRIVLAIFRHMCLFFSHWKPMSAHLRVRHPVILWEEIQYAVNARKDNFFKLDQASTVKLI